MSVSSPPWAIFGSFVVAIGAMLQGFPPRSTNTINTDLASALSYLDPVSFYRRCVLTNTSAIPANVPLQLRSIQVQESTRNSPLSTRYGAYACGQILLPATASSGKRQVEGSPCVCLAHSHSLVSTWLGTATNKPSKDVDVVLLRDFFTLTFAEQPRTNSTQSRERLDMDF